MPKDITDDGSGDIKACLCSTDYCNDIDDVDIGIENEVFDLNRLFTLRAITFFLPICFAKIGLEFYQIFFAIS